MSPWNHATLYPVGLIAIDCALGAVCFEAGAVAVAVVLWLTAVTICLSLLSSFFRELSNAANRPFPN